MININKYIFGLDLAKENTDNTCICFHFRNTCLEEMKELWSIGDEYEIPDYHKKHLGLNEDSKLIISEIYEAYNKEVAMNMLVR